MNLLPYAVAGSLLALGCTIDRNRKRRAQTEAQHRNQSESSHLEAEIQDEALARANSEVRSGEIDMLG